MKGLHQKVLMETSWTWNHSLYVRGKEGEWDRQWREAAVCPDWEGHGVTVCPIIYSDCQRIGDKGVSCHKTEELWVEGGVPTSLCQHPEDRRPADSGLSFTPPDLFELLWSVRCQPVWTFNSVLTAKPHCQQHSSLKTALSFVYPSLGLSLQHEKVYSLTSAVWLKHSFHATLTKAAVPLTSVRKTSSLKQKGNR